MNRTTHRRRTYPALGFGLAVALLALLASGACAPKEQEVTPTTPVEEETAFDPATTTWNPAALAATMPGLVGWQSVESGGGALVALSPDGTSTVIWSSPAGEDVVYGALAIDPNGPRVLCDASAAGADAGTVRSLVMLGADASVEELPMPEGFEGVIGATFAVDGRPLVVVYHGTMEEFETQIGTYSDDGAWEPVALAGELPEHQFVERIAAVPGTDAIALVLKTPGGTGDRDDEALVLAKLDGLTLTAYTPAFRDDALVGAAPLWGAEGVVYPRTPSSTGIEGVVDLIRADWTGEAWTEVPISEGAPLSTGIETGDVVAQDSTGLYWVRMASDDPDGGGTTLAQFDAEEDMITPTPADLSDIDWFEWLEPSAQ